MKNKLFYNDIAFRLMAPILFGIVIYLLVLMFFDSIVMLGDNFFSREVLFSISLAYLFFELNRLIIVLSNKLFKKKGNLRLRIIFQYTIAILVSVLSISSALYLYFIYIEGFSTIATEVITFNSIFFVVVVFYHLFFFSLIYLNRKNEFLVKKELNKRANLDAELQAYKYQIDPTLLFQSLEIIITELHSDREEADHLVNVLSKIYRYTLDNQDNDLVPVKDEIESLKLLLSIFKHKYFASLHLELDIDMESEEKSMIPGTLRILLEKALSENIISEKLKMNITLSTSAKELRFAYPSHPKIENKSYIEDRIRKLKNAYTYFSSIGIQERGNGSQLLIALPLLDVEEEEE
jgi:sensor histidine kinase YesM